MEVARDPGAPQFGLNRLAWPRGSHDLHALLRKIRDMDDALSFGPAKTLCWHDIEDSHFNAPFRAR